jgi:hypothetical protein
VTGTAGQSEALLDARIGEKKTTRRTPLLANPIEIQRHLKGVDYPAERDELLEVARGENAPQDVIEALESLPEDEEFDGPDEVMRAIED